LNWVYKKHDFSAIEETLIKYFPIANLHDYNKENIKEFKGYQDIGEILNVNFATNKNYREKWGKFKKHLKKELRSPVLESMVYFYPCYSGFITLKKEKNNNLTYSKELHFFISLLGPYYSIFGVDKCEIMLEELTPRMNGVEEILTRPYRANLAITVYPYLEFQESFQDLQNKILDYFPSLKFVPYSINMRKEKGISLLYPSSDEKINNTVFSALFRPDFFFNSEPRGDTFYGFNEWLKIKKLDKSRIEKIKVDLLSRSLKIELSTITVNKIWKFNKVIRLENSKVGHSMFVMESIEVLDLSNEKFATIISAEDEEPIISKYSIVNNKIKIDHFQNKLGFRIKELHANELKLIIDIDIKVDDMKEIKGDIIEMIFEVYK
jgi:hypothetical protein